MPITISDTSLVIDGSKVSWTVPSPLLFMGEIMRIYNSSSTTQTYDYTAIDGIEASTSVSATTSSYILVKSGSAVDTTTSASILGPPLISATKLFITSSELGNPFAEQLITATGAGTWIKPSGVTQVVVECWGGGAAGAGVTGTNAGGGGGGGGQYTRKFIIYPSAQTSVPYSVGTGGTGGTGNGADGTSTTWNTNQVIAIGGTGGATAGQGGLGNQAGSVGDVIYFGGNGDGGFGVGGQAVGGAGGGGGGSTANKSQLNSGITANGTIEYGGIGGVQISTIGAGVAGSSGDNYSAGGGGAAKVSGGGGVNGGNGTQGLIRILYR